MENKYIITLEEIPFERFHSYNVPSERLYRVQGFNSLVFDGNGLSKLTPYTEPDMEKVRKESCDKCMNEVEDLAYQLYSVKIDEAYQRGLNDAWDAARKIVLSREDGGLFSYEERKSVFGCGNYMALKTFLAPEAIEKIRQYEEQKEIKVWDEVRHKSCNKIKIVVLNKESDAITGIAIEDVPYACKVGEMYINRNEKDLEKTGKHYDIAEVLRKMKEKEA